MDVRRRQQSTKGRKLSKTIAEKETLAAFLEDEVVHGSQDIWETWIRYHEPD